MEPTKLHHAKNDLIVTARLAGSVNVITLRKYATTGNDFVDAVLKQHKKNHVKYSYKADDIVGVMNVRTLRFLRLNNKVADQISSDMLWLITYGEWEEYRKSLEFDKPVTRRTAIMIPQHPSGLSEEKKRAFVEKYDSALSDKDDSETTLKSAIDGIETKSPYELMAYLGSKHRLSILDMEKDSTINLATTLPTTISPSNKGVKSMTMSEIGGGGREKNSYSMPSARAKETSASGPAIDRNASPPSFFEVSTPFIRRLATARDRERPKRTQAEPLRQARDRDDITFAGDKDGEGDYDKNYVDTSSTNESPPVSVSVSLSSSSVKKESGTAHMTASKEAFTPRTPAPGPGLRQSQSQSRSGAHPRPSVVKSVVLADLGTHHYSSASEDENEDSPIALRTPSASSPSRQRQPTSPPELVDNVRRGSIVSLTEGGSNGNGFERLKALLSSEDVVLVAIPREQVTHFRNLSSLEKTVLPDYSAIVRQLVEGSPSISGGGSDSERGELEGQLAYHVQALEAERKANEINLRALRSEHQSIVSQMTNAHEKIVKDLQQDYNSALGIAEKRVMEIKSAAESSIDASADSSKEKLESLQQQLDSERQQNKRRENESEEEIRKIREASKAQKTELEAKIAEMKWRYDQELQGYRETLDTKQAIIREHETGVHNAQKTALQDKIAALEERLEEARLSAEHQRLFLVGKADEQKATLERLLEEERQSSARALQSHRDASEQRMATLREQADGTIEYRLRVAEERTLAERQAAEDRAQSAAQEHALAMEAAQKAADERYAQLEMHQLEVLEMAKKSAETRIEALKRLVEEERIGCQDKIEIASRRHEKEILAIKEQAEEARKAQMESHAHKEQVSRARQEDLLARLDSVRKSFETKLESLKQESEDTLIREKARLEARIAQLTDHHSSEIIDLRDSHTKKIAILQDSLRDHSERVAQAEDRLAAAGLDHRKALESHKDDTQERLNRISESHAEALQEHEQARILLQDQAARREKELRESHEETLSSLRSGLEIEKDRYSHLHNLYTATKRQTDEMVEQVAAPLRTKLADIEGEMTILKAQQKNNIEEAISRVKNEHEATIVGLKKVHATLLESKENEKSALLERLDSELTALRETHAEEMKAKDRERTLLLERHEATLADLEKQMQEKSTNHSAQLESLKAAHEESLKALQGGYESHLVSLKESHEKFITDTANEHDKKLESLRLRMTADHDGMKKVHEKALSLQETRLEQYIATYEALKSEMETKLTEMRDTVEKSKQDTAAKDEELGQALQRIRLQEEMLSAHDKASTAHKSDYKAAEERYLKLQQQHEEATRAAEDSKAFITARYEERLAAVQLQLNEEKERSTQRLAALDREHRDAMEALQAQEAKRRDAIEKEHAVHVLRLKESLDTHLQTERDTLKKRHTALGVAHQSEITSLQASYDNLLSQEKKASETERNALFTRLEIAESSAKVEIQTLKEEYDKQVISVKEQHQRALDTVRSEMEQLAASQATAIQANHAAELSSLNRQTKERVADLERSLRQKEKEMAELSQEHSHRLEFVQKQMQRAIHAEGTDLVSITSPAVKMQHDAINSSVVSHLSVDDDDDDDDADSGADTENSTTDEGGNDGKTYWAVPPDAGATAVSHTTSPRKEPKANRRAVKHGQSSRRTTVAVPKGARLFTPTRATDAAEEVSGLSEDALDNALQRQAELEKTCQELSNRLATMSGKRRVSFGFSEGGNIDGTPETTQTPSSSTPTESRMSTPGVGSAGMDDVDSLELDPVVLKQRLEEVNASKWKLEIQRDAMQLKLRVVEKKYQKLISALETKISNLKDMHAKAKEVIHTGYERRLNHGTRQQQMDAEELKTAHAVEKARLQEALETKHSAILREHMKKYDESREREKLEAEGKRIEEVRVAQNQMKAQEKALFAAQQEFSIEKSKLQAALSEAENENKNLVAAVEEFRIMLMTGKRYQPKDIMESGNESTPGSATGQHNQYTNLFRWITENIDDPAEKLLSRTSPTPFRIQRWKAAQETARKRAEEKRQRGEQVDDDEIAETAYMEYYKGVDSGNVSMDMAYYDPKASDEPSPRAQAALDEKLTLPIIYDNVMHEDEESYMANPMKMAVSKPSTPSKFEDPVSTSGSKSVSIPKETLLPRREQLVLEVENEIEKAHTGWVTQLQALEEEYLTKTEDLKGQIDDLKKENDRLPILERKLSQITVLLERNRLLALKWVAKKQERNRLERSAKKLASVWAHHVDARHWADVDDEGNRTPSRNEKRHDNEALQKEKSTYGFW